MKGSSPVVELKLPVLPDMELSATKTAEIVAKHMELSEEKSAEISMALIEACINAFEHTESNKQIEIHFRIKGDELEIQVTDKGKGFDESKVEIPKIEEKIGSDQRGWGLQLIKELNDIRKQRGEDPVLVGAGINKGFVVSGNIGSRDMMDYTVIGDPVNLAARLEGANKMYGSLIMISEFTYEKVKDKVEVREMDLIAVKGKEKPVRIYELQASTASFPGGLG